MTTMKPPYLEKGYSKYGAQMGRRNHNASSYGGEKLHLRRVPIDSGGYDPGGAYWGLGASLWCAWGEIEGEWRDGLVELYTRAQTRTAAKIHLADELPVAPRWYR